MIRLIIDLLQADEWINCGEAIEIAKGKNELPKTFKAAKKKIYRKWQSKK